MQVPSKFVWMKWAASSFFPWCPIDSHACSFSFLMSHSLTEPSWEQLNSELALFQFSEIPITGSLWVLKLSTIFLSSKILMLQSSYAPMTHRGWEMSLTLNKSNTYCQKDWHRFVAQFVHNLLSLNIVMNQWFAVKVIHDKVRIRTNTQQLVWTLTFIHGHCSLAGTKTDKNALTSSLNLSSPPESPVSCTSWSAFTKQSLPTVSWLKLKKYF